MGFGETKCSTKLHDTVLLHDKVRGLGGNTCIVCVFFVLFFHAATLGLHCTFRRTYLYKWSQSVHVSICRRCT